MVKPLSEQLADLSVRAKSNEDALAAAQKEAHDKIEARKQQARAAATKAIEKVKSRSQIRLRFRHAGLEYREGQNRLPT